jgi:hypothetical protein
MDLDPPPNSMPSGRHQDGGQHRLDAHLLIADVIVFVGILVAVVVLLSSGRVGVQLLGAAATTISVCYRAWSRGRTRRTRQRLR